LDFPLEFDPCYYRSIHPDLWEHDEAALIHHYETFGRAEGRCATAAVPRENFLALIPTGVTILEIGPFNNPAVSGCNVRYFDVLDKDCLIARAQLLGLPHKDVPDIKYVHPTGDLGIVPEQFDVVVSSHLLEHQPDLVRHLCQVTNILNDDGLYFCLIPDKRYCFDYFLPESSIADILDAHQSGRSVHTLGNVIKHAALVTHNDPRRHWSGDHGFLPVDPRRVEAGVEEYQSSNGCYLDVHAWQFTPSLFKNNIRILNNLGYIALQALRVYDTPFESNEFYAILKVQRTCAATG
jgi:SAM-dependent methyltransferase